MIEIEVNLDRLHDGLIAASLIDREPVVGELVLLKDYEGDRFLDAVVLKVVEGRDVYKSAHLKARGEIRRTREEPTAY